MADADGCDVTIYLVRKEQGSTKKRKRRSVEYARENGPPALANVRADSTRLRQCSKYFERWMSQRREMHTQGTLACDATSEFWLQAETEVLHYHDCFSRMYFPFKPFWSVMHCIEVIKVAVQIEFDEVVNRGVRYLTAVRWSDEEEQSIREFYSTGGLSTHSTSDLCARLQLPLNKEERQQELVVCVTEGVLDQYMRLAISEVSNRKKKKKSCKMFAEAFLGIVSGFGPGKSRKLLQYALDLVREESERLLLPVMSLGSQTDEASSLVIMQEALSNFCWLFGVVREANAAEEVVVLLLRADDLPKHVRAAFRSITESFLGLPSAQKKWAKMVYQIFRDVLDGLVLLKASERLTLFENWNWLLQDAYLEADKLVVATVVSQFIMSFTHGEQRRIFFRWVNNLDDPQRQADYNLSQAHSLWIKCLVNKAVQQVPECGPSNWERGLSNGGSSSDMEARWDSVLSGGQETILGASNKPSLNRVPANESSPAVATDEASPSSVAASKKY